MALRRSARRKQPARDNRRKASRPRTAPNKAKKKAQSVLGGYSKPRQLQHQQDRIDAGLGLDPSLAQPPPFQPLEGDEPPLPRLDPRHDPLLDANPPQPIPTTVEGGQRMPLGQPDTTQAINTPAGPITTGVGSDYDPEVGQRLLEQELEQWRQNDPVMEFWRNKLDRDPAASAQARLHPDAAALLEYINNPDMERPPTQPGWNPRFAGLAAERAARRRPATVPSEDGNPYSVDPSEHAAAMRARHELPGLREREWADLTTERMDDELPVTPDSIMTTHPGTAASGVSALPRPMGRVEAELAGKPNFDRAAGPGNEKWMAAQDRRAARRDEAREAITEREAGEAEARRRRLEARREPPRPGTAGMGALWRIDPTAAAKIGVQQQQNRAYRRTQQQKLHQQQQQFEARGPTRKEELRTKKMQNDLMEEATTEEKQLQSRWDELQSQIMEAKGAGQPEEAAKLQQEQRNVEDQLEEAQQRIDRLAGAGAGGQDGDIPTPRTVGQRGEPVATTQDDELDYNQISSTSPVKQALGQEWNDIDPLKAAGTLASWRRDRPKSRVPSDDELEVIIPKLRGAELNEKLVVGRDNAERNAMVGAAHEMYEDEPVEEARKRVKAAMNYFGKPADDRGKLPTVGGYKLQLDEEGASAVRYGGPRLFTPPPAKYSYTWEPAD